ncbi:lefty1 [Callorhinchus milii]|uniref:Left-right determination factor n=2 Tax=Callorhinchus milii TaxID=7868 RepID=A0A4W3KDU6_CALMI|nr:lefty1 [Callorhinchus milii]|eukprot:gi/632960933/ref/XP_007896477.1/ PREDICTED: left-right determination factor 2-like [Callorhinchus milii]
MANSIHGWTTMLLGFVICAVWAIPADATSHDDIKYAMLRTLGLKEIPKIEKRDLEKMVIPAHVRNRYISMLHLHKDKERKRRALPSLAGILRGVSGNADTTGEVLYSDPTRQRLVFDMKGLIPKNSEVTMAELKLFKKGVHKGDLPLRKHHRPVHNARVSVYWVKSLPDGTNRTSLIDSRLVPILYSGWKSLDVTQAVHYWMKNANTPMYLEIWVEAERVGSYAAEVAKHVHFGTQGPADKIIGKPELVLYTLNLEEYGGAGDCRVKKSGMCCRQEHFINFRELTWTQYWIIEPPGYQAFRCAGSCKQPTWPFHYGERSCAVLESVSLPIMYLVKKGDYTEVEVAEFPSMIVEKCGCVMDNASVM